MVNKAHSTFASEGDAIVTMPCSNSSPRSNRASPLGIPPEISFLSGLTLREPHGSGAHSSSKSTRKKIRRGVYQIVTAIASLLLHLRVTLLWSYWCSLVDASLLFNDLFSGVMPWLIRPMHAKRQDDGSRSCFLEADIGAFQLDLQNRSEGRIPSWHRVKFIVVIDSNMQTSQSAVDDIESDPLA